MELSRAPHQLTDRAILVCLQSFPRRVRPGGVGWGAQSTGRAVPAWSPAGQQLLNVCSEGFSLVAVGPHSPGNPPSQQRRVFLVTYGNTGGICPTPVCPPLLLPSGGCYTLLSAPSFLCPHLSHSCSGSLLFSLYLVGRGRVGRVRGKRDVWCGPVRPAVCPVAVRGRP